MITYCAHINTLSNFVINMTQNVQKLSKLVRYMMIALS